MKLLDITKCARPYCLKTRVANFRIQPGTHCTYPALSLGSFAISIDPTAEHLRCSVRLI